MQGSTSLIQLIYASTAVRDFSPAELVTLLRQSREANAAHGVTGMLLHEKGAFLQVLEGPEEAVVKIYTRIAADARHHRPVKIIQEPIAKRSFASWTMGFAEMKREELAEVEGLNDFFGDRLSLAQLGSSRAKKLLAAFGEGRWHGHTESADTTPAEPSGDSAAKPENDTRDALKAPAFSALASAIRFSYAFQPIVDTERGAIVSYEALIRGPGGEPAWSVLNRVPPEDMHRFDLESRMAAIALAAQLKMPCDLNLNFLPRSLGESTAALDMTLGAAESAGFPLDRLVIEVTEGEVIDNHARFAQLINSYRSSGLTVAIDDFGAGYSGLNLLAEFQPDQIKIDMALVRGIEGHGPRQAIARAILGACRDLGIDVIAEGVETQAEYHWLSGQGVRLYQGYLFARPGFESLPDVSFPAV